MEELGGGESLVMVVVVVVVEMVEKLVIYGFSLVKEVMVFLEYVVMVFLE